MTSKRLAFGGAAILLLSSMLTTQASADCDTRHFYNNSDVNWILTMGNGTGSCSIGPKTGRQCVIPARTSADIHYADTLAATVVETLSSSTQKAPNGEVLITSDDGGKIYAEGSFRVEKGVSCHLAHNGSTGNVVLNDPADGDIVTCGPFRKGQKGGGYDCR